MTELLELYIGNRKVDFTVPPEILYTYQQSEIENPTVVKNSFSKTVTIDGTKNNNQIFGDYWNLERIEGDGINGNGVTFNSSKKIDFVLYVNSEIYESGYAKLDSVIMKNGIPEYSVTLYGGLGEFFFNLSTNEENGEKLKLSDLDFLGTVNPENEFDFTINMDTVKEAWENIDDPDSPKWNTINFMPSYNGLPDNFDANKCLINLNGTELQKTVYDKEENIYYGAPNGLVMADLPADLTEHEMRDYRSYLMRPAIRMRKVIEACCNPRNNGGYTVELDNDFFNNSNPYWSDTFLTLPMIGDLELGSKNQIMEGATLTASTTTGDKNEYMYSDVRFTLGSFSPDMTSLTLGTHIKVSNVYRYSSFMLFLGKNSDRSWDRWDCFGSLFCQLLAYNGDTVVGASETYNLTSPIRHHNNLYFGQNDRYSGDGKYTPNSYNTEIYNSLGLFESAGFSDEDGNLKTFYFHINNLNTQVTSLKMRYFWGASEAKMKRYKNTGKNVLFDKAYDNSWSFLDNWDVRAAGTNPSDIKMDITTTNIQAIAGESLGRTGTQIKKSQLLNTEYSPCDYLLSYCKQFGLYFSKDLDDKKIYIQTRRTYYQRDKVIDLEKLVDRSKDININPLTFKTKWLQFSSHQDESYFANKYKLAEGYEYGCKMVNTGYDFSSEKEDILKDICLSGAVEGHEKSKYFTMYQKDDITRPWMVGMKYNLVNGDKKYEVSPTVQGKLYGINEGNGMKFYDLVPKVQFRNDDNSGLDGNNVLVFYSGFKRLNAGRANNINYILSDDNQFMTALNEGSPCWLFTKDEMVGNVRLCYKLEEIPVFERYRTQDGSGSITNSLDFGAPRQLFCQGYEYNNASTIYDTYWDTYIKDLYDVNTKVLTCYVMLKERPNPSWLRRFYWFDNCIWRLNKISDWNVSSNETTKMEFIKVQDLNAYTNRTAQEISRFSIVLDRYSVAPSGGTVNATVYAEEGTRWTLSWTDGIVPSISSGVGTTTFTITVPLVDDNERHQYTIIARSDVSATATILQDVEGDIRIVEIGEYADKNIPSTGASTTLEVTSVYPWTLSADRNWVSFDRNRGSEGTTNVVVTFPESDTIAFRTVTVTFTDQYGNTAEWKKTQEPLKELIYPVAGGSKTLYVGEPNVIFSVPSWITVTDNGDGSYTFTARENEGSRRTNGITGVAVRATPSTKGDSTTDNSKYYAVTAIQEGNGGGGEGEGVFAVSPNSLSFLREGSTSFITVTNTLAHNWKVMSKPDWISLTQSYGSGSAMVGVTATSNPNTAARTGAIIIKDMDTNKEFPINLTQFGTDTTRTFTVNPLTINVPKEGGTYPVTLTYINRGDDFVVPTIDGNGITVSKIVWFEDSANITIKVDPNTTIEAKQMSVTFTPNETPAQTVAISQEAGDTILNIVPRNFTFDYVGGVATFEIESNTDWTIE